MSPPWPPRQSRLRGFVSAPCLNHPHLDHFHLRRSADPSSRIHCRRTGCATPLPSLCNPGSTTPAIAPSLPPRLHGCSVTLPPWLCRHGSATTILPPLQLCGPGSAALPPPLRGYASTAPPPRLCHNRSAAMDPSQVLSAPPVSGATSLPPPFLRLCRSASAALPQRLRIRNCASATAPHPQRTCHRRSAFTTPPPPRQGHQDAATPRCAGTLTRPYCRKAYIARPPAWQHTKAAGMP